MPRDCNSSRQAVQKAISKDKQEYIEKHSEVAAEYTGIPRVTSPKNQMISHGYQLINDSAKGIQEPNSGTEMCNLSLQLSLYVSLYIVFTSA